MCLMVWNYEMEACIGYYSSVIKGVESHEAVVVINALMPVVMGSSYGIIFTYTA